MSAMRIAALAASLTLTYSAPVVAQQKHMQLLAPRTGWFLGQGKLRWTHDDGAHWVDITPRMSLPREKIADVYFKDVYDGWVLLSTDENTGPEAAFEVASTTNSGGTWAITPVDIPGTAQGRAPLFGQGLIFFLDPMHGWLNLALEGSQNFSPALLLATEDGGNTWIPKASPGRGAVRFTTPTDGWVAGGPGGEYLYSSKDGGMSWQPISLMNPGAVYNSAPIFSDQKHAFLPVTQRSAGAMAMVLFATDDGGQSWKPYRTFSNSQRFVTSTVADSVWFVAKGDQSSITLIKTQLSPGATGVETRTAAVQKATFPTSIHDISFATSEQGWVLTDRLYAAVDGGQAWKDITPWPAPN